MQALSPRLEFDPSESVQSYVARSAAFHIGERSTPFLRDIGIAPMTLVSGEPAAVERLSEVTGADHSNILSNTAVRVGKRSYDLRGNILPAEFFARPATAYCPACLKEDDAAGGPAAVARRHRWIWSLDVVRTCPEHGLPLVRLPKQAHDDELHELGIRAPAPGAALDREIDGLTLREVSPLQLYVVRRLEGEAGPEWLDAQGLDIVVRASELLGAVIAFGIDRNLTTMTDDERDRAGRVGFSVMERGEVGVREALEELYVQFKGEGGNPGPQRIFGRLYTAVTGRGAEGRHGDLTRILREFIFERFALPDGAKVLGEVLPRRRLHTVATLAAEAKLDSRTLRRVLVARGLLVDDDPMHRTFDFEAGRAVAATIRRGITVIMLPEALGCSRPLVNQLLDEHLLVPLAELNPEASGGTCKSVDAEHVRHFLERIRAAAPAVAVVPTGLVPIAKASEKAKRPAVEIVQLILGGFLSHVVRLEGAEGLAALRVDAGEVKSVIKDVMVGMSPAEAFGDLRVPNRAGWALVERGELSAIPINCPNRAHRIHRFRHEEVRAASDRLVSAVRIAEPLGRSARNVEWEFRQKRVRPAFPKADIGINLYFAADAERVFPN